MRSDFTSQRTAPLRPCTYPARPLSGGPLDRALPKSGLWHYEPKYNGWRALVHAPSGIMFNRHGQRLSIQREFGAALAILRGLQLTNGGEVVEWFDCEALERRHAIGRGTLLVATRRALHNRRGFELRVGAMLHAGDYARPSSARQMHFAGRLRLFARWHVRQHLSVPSPRVPT